MRLGPGLHRIGSDLVNAYLVEGPAGLTIIDAGLPGHWRELEQELTQLSRSLDDIRGIVLTHGDTGHTPGSVAVHIPVVDAVFVGDAMTTGNVLTGERGPGPAPFTLDPEAALASLAKLEPVQATWVLPGHGAPWRGGVAEAIRQVRQVAAVRP